MFALLTDEDDEGVEVEVGLALVLALLLGPDGGEHAQGLGDEDHGAGRLVDAVLVEVVELLLQQDLGVVVPVLAVRVVLHRVLKWP